MNIRHCPISHIWKKATTVISGFYLPSSAENGRTENADRHAKSHRRLLSLYDLLTIDI